MPDYPAVRDCGRCGAPALYKLATFAPHEQPLQVLTRRAHYRCSECYATTLSAAGLLALGDGALVVVDAAFTRDMLGTLPADATRPLPPIGQTIRRRPPALEVVELSTPELVAEAMRDEGLQICVNCRRLVATVVDGKAAPHECTGRPL